MNVLVAGGDGFVGGYLCGELTDRGHDVTAMSRSPDPDAVPDGVATTSGDVTDYGSIEGPVADHDAVVNLVALSPLFQPKDGNEMHHTVHTGGTSNLVRAAEEGGVKRFVQMSALGADPEGTTHYIRAKGEAENVVRESDLDWVIFRPSVVFGEGGEFVSFTRKLTTPYVSGLPGGGKSRFQPIHVQDLVPMLADGVEGDEYVGEAYEIGGPEVLTLADVAKLSYRASGQSVKILPVPMVLAGLGLSVAGAIPGFPMGADQYRSLKFDNTTDDNDVGAFGVSEDDLTRLSAYLGLESGTA